MECIRFKRLITRVAMSRSSWTSPGEEMKILICCSVFLGYSSEAGCLTETPPLRFSQLHSCMFVHFDKYTSTIIQSTWRNEMCHPMNINEIVTRLLRIYKWQLE